MVCINKKKFQEPNLSVDFGTGMNKDCERNVTTLFIHSAPYCPSFFNATTLW